MGDDAGGTGGVEEGVTSVVRIAIRNDPRLYTVRNHGHPLAARYGTGVRWIKSFRGRARADDNRILAPDARKEGGKIVTLHRDRSLGVDAKDRVASATIGLIRSVRESYSDLRRGGGLPLLPCFARRQIALVELLPHRQS